MPKSPRPFVPQTLGPVASHSFRDPFPEGAYNPDPPTDPSIEPGPLTVSLQLENLFKAQCDFGAALEFLCAEGGRE